MTNQLANIHGLFPTPVYTVNRDSNLIPKEDIFILLIFNFEFNIFK